MTLRKLLAAGAFCALTGGATLAASVSPAAADEACNGYGECSDHHSYYDRGYNRDNDNHYSYHRDYGRNGYHHTGYDWRYRYSHERYDRDYWRYHHHGEGD